MNDECLLTSKFPVFLLVASLLLLFGCSSDNEEESRELGFSLETKDVFQQQESIFNQGEEITFELLINNDGGEQKTLEFGTTQKYDFALYTDKDVLVWQWSTDTEQIFLPVLTELRLEPYSSESYQVVWDQRLARGTYLTPQQYELRAYLLGTTIELACDITIQ